MISGDYQRGSLVLVWNNFLDFQFGNKGALRWQGPYAVVQRRPSGAYVLAELDGTVLVKPFAARRLKLYHFHDNKKPIVRDEWQYNLDNSEIRDEDVEGSETSETMNVARVVVHKIVRPREGPKLPRAWELRGKECDEYWQKKYDDWKSGENAKRLQEGRPSDWEIEIDKWNKEDAQFWDFRWDFKDFDIENMPRWKNKGPEHPTLFTWKKGNEWLPPGPPKFKVQTAKLFNIPSDTENIALLGTPHITPIPKENVVIVSADKVEDSFTRDAQSTYPPEGVLFVNTVLDFMRDIQCRRTPEIPRGRDHWSPRSEGGYTSSRKTHASRTPRPKSPVAQSKRELMESVSDGIVELDSIIECDDTKPAATKDAEPSHRVAEVLYHSCFLVDYC